jgi:hypothetical protein
MNEKPSLRWRFYHWLSGGNLGALKRWSAEQRRLMLMDQGFHESDPNVIATLTDKKLAEFQIRYPSESRQFIIAEYEWQRRLTAQQIKATYRTAWIGIFGVILGYGLTKLDSFIYLFINQP